MKVQRIAALAAGAALAAASPAGASVPHTVQPGETLSGIAAANGVSTSTLAAANGMSPTAFVISGSTIQIPSATMAPAAPAAPGASTSSAQIGAVAAQQGVSGSLASAIAWQESGFNNGVVSSAGAQGVMQVTPAAVDQVEQAFGTDLDPASTQDNVTAGSLYLSQLLAETGGDERMAVAAYYQGLASVRENGVFAETAHYVENVMALRARFGG
jgi:N-acetylmuramoyl-L-alanine amidase